MENKKAKSANLERRRGLFFSLGLVICSSAVLMAFTYNTANDGTSAHFDANDRLGAEIVYELPPIEEQPEDQPEQPQTVVIIDQVNVVDDNVEIDEIDFIDPNDIDPDDIIEEFDDIQDEPILDIAEIEPTFPGGEGAMMQWIQENVVYPQEAIEMGEQGMVYVQFVVNTDGSIEQVNVVRGVSESLDAESKKVVKKMPKWTPGEQAGKKVRCRFTLPINFISN